MAPNAQTAASRANGGMRTAVLAGLAVAIVTPVAHAWQVRLRNDLSAGSLTVYVVSTKATRTTRDNATVEALTYVQEGRLTLLVAEGPDKKTARRIWMMELEAPRIESLTRDGQTVEDLPDPKEAGLPPRGVQLRVTDVTATTAPAYPVGGSDVQRAGLLLALDFARWPDALVKPEESWDSSAEREELSGVWTHTYTHAEGERSERLAVGRFQFQGRLTGSLAGIAQIERVEGEWKWRVAKRSMESSSTQVALTYGHPETQRRLEMTVGLQIQSRDHLASAAQTQAAEDIRQLDRLAEAPSSEARTGLQQFVESRTDSLWLPVGRDLLDRVVYTQTTLSGLEREQLEHALTELIVRWQTSAVRGESEPLEPIRATFRALTEGNRSLLAELTRADDANIRAIAVFCLAFGEAPADLARVIELCRDDSPRVRAWAAYGLAERRATEIDEALLLELLADDDEAVRIRACMTASTCVAANAPHRKRVLDRLLNLLQRDASEQVREQAAIAIDRVVDRGDLPKLIDAESNQDMPPIRRLLEQTIRRLGGEPKRLP